MVLKKYNTDTLTLSRALLALGFLLTLSFNNINELFPIYHLSKIKSLDSNLMWLNIFTWFNDINIPYYISIFILMLVILGIYPRITSILHFIITFSVFNSMLIIEGGDQIAVILSLLFIPICISDKRSNGWSRYEHSSDSYLLSVNSNIAKFLLTIQIAVLYFNAGIAKIYAPEWSTGTAVYYWFNDNVFGANNTIRFLFENLFTNDYTVTFINWGTILFEIFLSLQLLLSQKIKYVAFIFGLLFHLFIVLTHGLFTFCLSMTSCLIIYLWRVDLTIKQNIQYIIYIKKSIRISFK